MPGNHSSVRTKCCVQSWGNFLGRGKPQPQEGHVAHHVAHPISGFCTQGSISFLLQSLVCPVFIREGGWRHGDDIISCRATYSFGAMLSLTEFQATKNKLCKCCCSELGRVAARIGINRVIGFIYLFNHDFIYSTTWSFIHQIFTVLSTIGPALQIQGSTLCSVLFSTWYQASWRERLHSSCCGLQCSVQ